MVRNRVLRLRSRLIANASRQRILLLAACAALPACAERDAQFDNAGTQEMLALLMPQQVKIVEAFTEFRSFDDDDVPDGVELLLQAHDSFGDPVKMAGDLLVELYTFQTASAERKGQRICDPWVVRLTDERDQRRYWNTVTGMYEVPLEFPAGVPVGNVSRGGKYVLAVTYNSPLATHMTDECVIQAPAAVQ